MKRQHVSISVLTLAFGSVHRWALVEPHRTASMATDRRLASARQLLAFEMKPGVRQLHARGSITSYLESTAKHLIIVAASAVINAPCPAGVKTTAARAARWLASPVC